MIIFLDKYDPQHTVIVENIPVELEQEELELYFQSNKYSGGGATQKIVFEAGSSKAIIVFKYASSM